MSRSAWRLVPFAVICGLVYFLAGSAGHFRAPDWFSRNIEIAREFYLDHRLLTVALFCCAHLVSATLSLPGSCTLLNVAAGAIFGFWQGCAIVYPITMLSSALGYAGGRMFRSIPALGRFAATMDGIKAHAADRDYFYFVALRLSPLLPFGVLNLVMGFFDIPAGLYFLTTFVGIFFDVVLLTNVGAAAVGRSFPFVGSFFALLFAFLWIRTALRNRWGDGDRAGGAVDVK